MKDAVFDYERLLALDGMRDTQVFRVSASGMYPDGVIDVRYEGLPQGALAGATAWLQQNRVVLKDVVIAGVELPGTWRTVNIQEEIIVDNGRKTGTVLVQRFAKGLYDVLDWSVCRVEQGSWAHGNTKDADGTANTLSALYQRWSVLRMPYVRPDRAEDIANSLRAYVEWTDLVAGGVKHDGVWFNLGATWRLEEDQTASVFITIAQSRFTIEGYRNNDTFDGERRFLVVNVPSHQIQAVLDAWKAGRPGADGLVESYHTERNTANLILSVPVPKAVSGQRVRISEDAFKIVTSTTSIHQLSAVEQPAWEIGKTVWTDNEKTPLGHYNVTVTEDVAKTGETPEHVVSVQFDGSKIKAHSARHLDPHNLPPWAEEPTNATVGKAVRVVRELNEYGGVSVQRQEREVTQVRRPTTGTYTYERDFGEVHIVEYDGVPPQNLPAILNEFATEPTNFAATHNISVAPEFDASTGTFSVRLVAVPKGGGSGGGGAKACEIEWTETTYESHREYDKTEDAVKSWTRATEWACGRKQSKSETEIQNWLEARKAASSYEFIARVGPLGRWGFFAEYRAMINRGGWSKDSHAL